MSPSHSPGAKSAFVGVLCLMAIPIPTHAQDAMLPVIAVSRQGEGADSFVFQCLLGGIDSGGALVGAELAGPMVEAKNRIRWVNMSGLQGGGFSTRAMPMEEPCDYAFVSDAEPIPPAVGAYLGVAGEWPVLPEVLRLHSPQSETYRTAAADYLQSIAFDVPTVILTQVIRTDLDSDGIEEVLLTITNDGDAIPTTIEPGDYSAILLRRLVDGTVETVVIDGEFHSDYQSFGAPSEFEIIAVADLNGDGVAEIGARVDYYEGASFVAYELVHGQPQLALTCGCGA